MQDRVIIKTSIFSDQSKLENLTETAIEKLGGILPTTYFAAAPQLINKTTYQYHILAQIDQVNSSRSNNATLVFGTYMIQFFTFPASDYLLSLPV